MNSVPKLNGCALLCAAVLTACADEPTQSDVEYRVANSMGLALEVRRALNQLNEVTNVALIFAPPNEKPWLWIEDQLLPFGATKGFKNSVLEKYVLLPGTNVLADASGIVCLASRKPFVDEKGMSLRVLVIQDKEKFRGRLISEEKFLALLARDGLKISDSELLNPIPRQPKQRTVADMSPAEIERLLNGPEAIRLETNSGPATGPRKAPSTEVKSREASPDGLVATTEHVRWWLPLVAVGCLASIAFMVARARRRSVTK